MNIETCPEIYALIKQSKSDSNINWELPGAMRNEWSRRLVNRLYISTMRTILFGEIDRFNLGRICELVEAGLVHVDSTHAWLTDAGLRVCEHLGRPPYPWTVRFSMPHYNTIKTALEFIEQGGYTTHEFITRDYGLDFLESPEVGFKTPIYLPNLNWALGQYVENNEVSPFYKARQEEIKDITLHEFSRWNNTRFKQSSRIPFYYGGSV